MKLSRMIEDPRPPRKLLEEDLRAQGIEPSELPRSVIEKAEQRIKSFIKSEQLNDGESAFDE